MRVAVALSLAMAGAAEPPPQPILPEMIRVGPGTFVAGSTPEETTAVAYPAAYAAREQPQRTVTIARSFAIARTEVTRNAFARFVAATGWRPDGPCGWLADPRTGRWTADTAHDWRNPGYAQTGRHPVVCVSLADAQSYARWLSAETGRRFRLPTNVEWEYAARGARSTRYWWGDTAAPAICRHANIGDRTRARANGADGSDPALYMPCEDGHAATAPVAAYRPNPWGLHDMLGNVWEWTSDCLAPDDCTSHIDRGASWTNSPRYVRIAAQHPDLVAARTAVLGFRLVEDLP